MEGGARDPGRPARYADNAACSAESVAAAREVRPRPGGKAGRYGASKIAACVRFANGQASPRQAGPLLWPVVAMQ